MRLVHVRARHQRERARSSTLDLDVDSARDRGNREGIEGTLRRILMVEMFDVEATERFAEGGYVVGAGWGRL